MKKMAAVIALLVLALSMASFAVVKEIKLTVVTKEKTVMIGDREVLGLIDFRYKVEKDKLIKEGGKDTPPIVAYRGNQIIGKIITSKPDATLDSTLDSKGTITFKFLSASKSGEAVKTFTFVDSTITGKQVKKAGKIDEITYFFRSSGLTEE